MSPVLLESVGQPVLIRTLTGFPQVRHPSSLANRGSSFTYSAGEFLQSAKRAARHSASPHWHSDRLPASSPPSSLSTRGSSFTYSAGEFLQSAKRAARHSASPHAPLVTSSHRIPSSF